MRDDPRTEEEEDKRAEGGHEEKKEEEAPGATAEEAWAGIGAEDRID